MNGLTRQPGNPVLVNIGIHCDTWRLPYNEILSDLSLMKISKYDTWKLAVREVCETDFFLFCLMILNLPVNDPFLLARCYEIQDHEDEDGLYLWARDHWKALAYDTPVMTSIGWKKHGELSVGDKVVGSSGDFIDVIARTENFEDSKQYEITFDKKYKIVCSCDHLWEVNKLSRKRISGTNQRVGRNKDLMTADEIFEYGCGEDKKLSVDVLPVNYSEKELEIHPYVLGAWLGDGSSADGRIHGIDIELFDRIKDLGYDIRDTSRDVTKSIHKFASILKTMGLKNNKNIPDNYKYSSFEQRMELIRGLMDTDGTIDDRCTCTFTNINKKLCDDLYEVLVSVGYKPNYRTHVGKFCDKNYVFYNVSFNARKEFNPFYLKRKADKVYLENKPKTRFITDIKPLVEGEYITNCIQVNSKDGIYLAGREMIPTHNSTLITYARTLWRFCRIYGNRVALFSNSTKLATPRFKQMKNVMETNALLHELWPEVFWKNPEKESPTWSIDDGLFLRGNDMPWPSLGRFGLIDSMPTGGHYNEKIIDDLVDLKNIGTAFMMEKVKEAYGMADNLGSGENTIETVIGTRYKFGDLYEHIMGLNQHRVSIIAGEVDEFGNAIYGGIPVLLSKEALDNKKIKQRHTYHAQILQQPLQQGAAAFKTDDLRFYDKEPDFGKYYIVADPATDPELSTNPGRLDSTVMWLVKACAGRRIYIIDMIRDKIGNKKKWSQLKDWHARYDIMDTGYEEFATQKDREYFKEKMEEERFYFKITPLKHNRGSKPERIGILADYFSEGKIYLPRNLMRLTRDRGVVDLISEFINDEYMKYPMTEHDDMLDALAKVSEMDIIYPEGDIEKEEQKIYNKPSPLDDDFHGVECHWGDL